MNRAPYLTSFSPTTIPLWACPTCGKGTLNLLHESLFQSETAKSKLARADPAWEPEWVHGVFSCIFHCTNIWCQEHVACSGTVEYSVFYFGEDEYSNERVVEASFTPQHFHPPLVLLDIPRNCPKTVSKQLTESFRVFYLSPAAALNSARSAIEMLLDELLVPRLAGKSRLNLHDRIDLLPDLYQDLKELLTAVKWLGNAGSHEGSIVVRRDVCDAYDLLEYVLTEIYEGKARKLKEIAVAINKQKGPLI